MGECPPTTLKKVDFYPNVTLSSYSAIKRKYTVLKPEVGAHFLVVQGAHGEGGVLGAQ